MKKKNKTNYTHFLVLASHVQTCYKVLSEVMQWSRVSDVLLCAVRESSVGPEDNQLLGLKVITSSPLPLKTHTGLTMTNHGDDCYFFYYSTCAKVSHLSPQR